MSIGCDQVPMAAAGDCGGLGSSDIGGAAAWGGGLGSGTGGGLAAWGGGEGGGGCRELHHTRQQYVIV